MSVRTSRLLLALALTLGSFAAFASSEDPIMARGFSPETMYQFGNLDSVNLFNGNLNETDADEKLTEAVFGDIVVGDPRNRDPASATVKDVSHLDGHFNAGAEASGIG